MAVALRPFAVSTRLLQQLARNAVGVVNVRTICLCVYIHLQQCSEVVVARRQPAEQRQLEPPGSDPDVVGGSAAVWRWPVEVAKTARWRLGTVLRRVGSAGLDPVDQEGCQAVERRRQETGSSADGRCRR